MSMPPSIRVEGLWKEYMVGQQVERHGTFYDLLSHWLRSPSARRDPAVSASGASAPSSFWALRDVSFEAYPGEVIGVIGRNGAGKSTLLKVLSRITAPTRGRIEIRGRLASLLEVGTGFHPELSGRENVFLNGAILGMSQKEVARKFDEIVAFAEVERFIDTPVKRYSSGMYVRLAFAVAAFLEMDVLIVDEVLAVGDMAFQKKCLGKMHEVASSGRTVFFVSHNLAAVRKLCTRAILMDQGSVAMDSDIATVFSSYIRSFTLSDEANPIVFAPDATLDTDIERIELLDEAGELVESVATFDFLRVRIRIKSTVELPGASVVFQVAALDGTVLILTSTQPDHTVPVDISVGDSFYDCVFEKFPFSAGAFRIGAGIAIPGVRWIVDRLDQAILNVAARDVFHSGQAPETSRYLLVAPHRWETGGATTAQTKDPCL